MVVVNMGIVDEQRALYESMCSTRAILRERWWLRVN